MSTKWTPIPLLTTSYDNSEGSGGGGKSTAIVPGLSRPMRLTVDNNHNGLLYIADSGNHRVLEIEVDSRVGSSDIKGQGQGKTVIGKVRMMHYKHRLSLLSIFVGSPFVSCCYCVSYFYHVCSILHNHCVPLCPSRYGVYLGQPLVFLVQPSMAPVLIGSPLIDLWE